MNEHTQHALDAETSQPERWWWLSFCDPERPRGQQFLGACVVRARGVATACRASWTLGCNPGGEMMALPAPEHFIVQPGWEGRLLTRAECDEFNRLHPAQA
jgi:hypothetical protein